MYGCQKVSFGEGVKFAKDNNCLFYITSAKDHDSVKNAFEGLARAYIIQIERKDILNNENIIFNKSNFKKIEYKQKKYNNGDKYEGQFLNNKKEGKGIMEYYNGDEYNGDWKNDKKEGIL